MTPTIHNNGTSRDELLRQQLDAADAVREAIDKLVAAAPNGRDYYQQGGEAITRAQADHYAQVLHLKAVLSYLEGMAQAIADA